MFVINRLETDWLCFANFCKREALAVGSVRDEPAASGTNGADCFFGLCLVGHCKARICKTVKEDWQRAACLLTLQ